MNHTDADICEMAVDLIKDAMKSMIQSQGLNALSNTSLSILTCESRNVLCSQVKAAKRKLCYVQRPLWQHTATEELGAKFENFAG